MGQGETEDGMQYILAIQNLLRKATTEQLAMIYHFIRGLLAAA